MGRVANLFFLIDALGWEIIKEKPILEGLVQDRKPLRTVLGYSSAAIPSILSGVPPSQHGHWSFFYYAPETSPFRWLRYWSWIPFTENRYTRYVLRRLFRRILGFSGYFHIYSVPFRHLPLFDYCEKRDILGTSALDAPTIFDYLQSNNLPYFCIDGNQSDSDNVAAAREVIAGGNIQFYYLYFGALDGIMHKNGAESPLMFEKLAWYEQQISSLTDLAKRHFDAVRLYVFSDHGMLTVTKHCNVWGEVDKLGFRFGQDFVAVYDSTMARFWFFSDAARSQIQALLHTLPYGRILSPQEETQMGVYFPDRRYGETTFLVEPGALIHPSFMGYRPLKGMHGYDPDHPSSDGALFCSEPIPGHISSTRDVYLLMREVADSIAAGSLVTQ